MNGLRTLIIDGALFTLKDMMGALSREMPGGSEFDKAVSIHEAAEKYHSFRPTRILVNYAMAGLRFGQEPFIDVLVQRTNVPIVAYGISRAMEPEAMKAGVSAFVTKPIARDRLPAFYRECADQLQKSARTPAVSRPAAKKSAPPSVRSRAATVGSLTRPDVRPSASAQSRPSRPAALQPHLRTRADRAVEAAQQAIARISGKKGAVPKAEPRRLTPTLQAELSRWPSPEIIVIGSSTGGTEALAEIFRTLKPPLPPIVIAQHIPSMFSRLFAQRLNGTSPLTIREGAQDVALERDHVYISPGGMHTVVADHPRRGTGCGPRTRSCLYFTGRHAYGRAQERRAARAGVPAGPEAPRRTPIGRRAFRLGRAVRGKGRTRRHPDGDGWRRGEGTRAHAARGSPYPRTG